MLDTHETSNRMHPAVCFVTNQYTFVVTMSTKQRNAPPTFSFRGAFNQRASEADAFKLRNLVFSSNLQCC